MPNLLVPIDLREGAPTEPSLFAVNESRRVARAAGATVFAVVLTERRPSAEVDRLGALLGLAGADKVLFCEGRGLSAPALDATHGPALLNATERVPPLLVLFPAGGAGLELGPPLAARLGAAFAGAADIEVSDAAAPLAEGLGRVQLRRWRRDRSGYRRLDPAEMERAVIAVLGAYAPPREVGTERVEIEVIECRPPDPPRVTELASEPDGDAAVALARALVLVDPAAGGAALAKLSAAAPPGVVVADLARVSPAALAASTPGVVLCVGTTEVRAAVSPRTRVGLMLTGATGATGSAGAGASPAGGVADVVWRVSGEPDWDELAAHLGRLADGGDGRGVTPR